jgi:geranylgeranyl diphosphate synthase type II
VYSIAELQNIINTAIKIRSEDLGKMNPANLYNPVGYSLEMGGKRLRPVLLLLGYNLFSDSVEKAIPAALAIEVFHNFTLLHDDIMDKAEVRRNRPTVHKKFSENSAILSGDVMAFLSYQYLLECKSDRLKEVIELFTKTAIEVCEGQQFDMEFENRLNVNESEYIEMIRLKTAVLLACGLKAGALLANAEVELANQLYEFGINLGLAFQLQDDLLDSFGNHESFGKKNRR